MSDKKSFSPFLPDEEEETDNANTTHPAQHWGGVRRVLKQPQGGPVENALLFVHLMWAAKDRKEEQLHRLPSFWRTP